MKISRIIGFIGIASVMTNSATVRQKDLQAKTLTSSDWGWVGTNRRFPYLDDEDFDKTLPNSWHWLDKTETIEFYDDPVIKDDRDWKQVNHLDYFKVKDIPQWTAELEVIKNQHEAKVVEMAKPTSYWFWKK